MSQDCVFCRIVAGTLPSYRICEDDHAVAFMDINPANPGHVLVVPREHAADVFAASAEALAAAIAMAQRVARAVQAELAPDGINLVQANGPGAAQSVAHLHIHVLPRRLGDDLAMNWGLVPGDRAAIQALAARLKAALAEQLKAALAEQLKARLT